MIVGRDVRKETADHFHSKMGDHIPIKAPQYGAGIWEFNLAGIHHGELAKPIKRNLVSVELF